MNDRKRNYLLVGAGILCFIMAAVMLHAFKGRFGGDTLEKSASAPVVMEDTIDVSQKTAAVNNTASITRPTPASDIWVIYITGAVKKPGVYKVPAGSRVYQALDSAGGFAANADQEAVNLAAVLGDGAHAHFPRKGESQQTTAQSVAAAPSTVASSQAAKNVGTGTLININSASQSELETLPGIGPKAAQAIISYREANGPFARTEDMLQVRGIGPKKYDALKNLVTVGK